MQHHFSQYKIYLHCKGRQSQHCIIFPCPLSSSNSSSSINPKTQSDCTTTLFVMLNDVLHFLFDDTLSLSHLLVRRFYESTKVD